MVFDVRILVRAASCLKRNPNIQCKVESCSEQHSSLHRDVLLDCSHGHNHRDYKCSSTFLENPSPALSVGMPYHVLTKQYTNSYVDEPWNFLV